MTRLLDPGRVRPLDQLNGKRIKVREGEENSWKVSVLKKLGEGGSAFVYLVRESSPSSKQKKTQGNRRNSEAEDNNELKVLKVSSVGTKEKMLQAMNEVRMLRKLSSHPNIVSFFGSGFQCGTDESAKVHYLLVEYCTGGSLLDLVLDCQRNESEYGKGGKNKISRKQKFNSVSRKRRSLSSCRPKQLDINDITTIFLQISSALEFLHNLFDDLNCDPDDQSEIVTNCVEKSPSSSPREQRQHHSPIIHFDIKLENILLVHRSNESSDETWSCKLCDFGSAKQGRVPLRSPIERHRATEMVHRTTTQMYRAPELIDFYMASELTELVDVWALGCCLYNVMFLRNIFDENANLAILSGNYEIPPEHQYSDNVIELIKRMLVVDPSERACINEVLECLQALKVDKALPSRAQKINHDGEDRESQTDDTRRPREILFTDNVISVSTIHRDNTHEEQPQKQRLSLTHSQSFSEKVGTVANFDAFSALAGRSRSSPSSLLKPGRFSKTINEWNGFFCGNCVFDGNPSTASPNKENKKWTESNEGSMNKLYAHEPSASNNDHSEISKTIEFETPPWDNEKPPFADSVEVAEKKNFSLGEKGAPQALSATVNQKLVNTESSDPENLLSIQCLDSDVTISSQNGSHLVMTLTADSVEIKKIESSDVRRSKSI
eukprot:CAMPEP_0195530648 /NCGR_PEP_ID=MMETSP0794_2-20130614/33628_1 /TAXON_ID=515487 /ORGANISM="Stephanopyxis turris, Strain CCMP 815" /LENGTH=663 /DNA_ID=CAMNT_0040662203 /DNA_START=52 /DNA_END=2043 /DNA_ORIENTATION=+